MYNIRYHFYEDKENDGAVSVRPEDLYDEEKGFGFLAEKNRIEQELLQLPELNSAFEPWYWLAGQELTRISRDETGCALEGEELVPLSFKCRVPKQGNYDITIGIEGGSAGVQDLMVFTGRRRLMERGIDVAPLGHFEKTYTVNICDIIPRGKEEAYEDTTLDVTLIGKKTRISFLEVRETECPTIFIAGDSTLTDQGAAYPYVPGASYCGWAQMLPAFLKKGVAVSNHAHSGLTTESFRNEGHFDIVRKYIKRGDYFLMQFGHNDQKLPHLEARGGYADNLRAYVREMQKAGAAPVIVTPLARNTWKGSDGSYNDLLVEFAGACREVAEEFQIPILDLHANSMAFIKKTGLEDAKRYFFPKDYTHSNDFGAYLMAGFVAEEMKKAGIPYEGGFVQEGCTDWIPPVEIEVPLPPADFKGAALASFEVRFTDIAGRPQEETIRRLAEAGIIPNDDTLFRPEENITRAEALAWIIKAVSFVPTNVYNDMYTDVIGHEWYAGTVECAFQNEIVDPELIDGSEFGPEKQVATEELLSFCVNAYKSRKILKDIPECLLEKEGPEWAKSYIRAGHYLGFIEDGRSFGKYMTREEAAVMIGLLVTE